MTPERKSEIRASEIRHAIKEVCEALGVAVPQPKTAERQMLIGALALYAQQTRRKWEARDSHQRFLEIMAQFEQEQEAEHSRTGKLQRLIDHPATPELERKAARLALDRLAGGRETT